MCRNYQKKKPLKQIGIIPESVVGFYACMNEMMNTYQTTQKNSIRRFLQSVVYDISLCYWMTNTEKSKEATLLIDVLRRNTYYRLETDCRWYSKWKEMDKGNWLDYFILTSYKVAHREIMAQYKNYRKYESAV